MPQLLVREKLPGAGAANSIMGKLAQAGIHDVKLMYDDAIQPDGMWAVVQIKGHQSPIIMPESYASTKLEPYILWWCKNDEARFREPNDEDLFNIINIVRRAPEIWAKGEKRADHFEKLDAEKDQRHKDKLKAKIHEIAPAMKKALKKGNL